MLRFAIMAVFILSIGACAQVPQPLPVAAPAAQEPGLGVTFDPTSGIVSLHAGGASKALGTILKDGRLEVADGVPGEDFAHALLIVIKSQMGDSWDKIASELPR